MKLLDHKSILVLVCGALIAASGFAATSSQLNNVWHRATFDRVPLKKILVIAFTDNVERRQKFESAFVRVIRQAGGKAEVSYLLMRADQEMGRASVKAAIEGKGFDCVMVSRLVDKDFAMSFSPPAQSDPNPAAPGSASSDFDEDYESTRNTVQTPGYFKKTMNIVIQTKIYESGGNLIWSAESETFDAQSIDNMVTSIAKAIRTDLLSKGFLQPR